MIFLGIAFNINTIPSCSLSGNAIEFYSYRHECGQLAVEAVQIIENKLITT